MHTMLTIELATVAATGFHVQILQDLMVMSLGDMPHALGVWIPAKVRSLVATAEKVLLARVAVSVSKDGHDVQNPVLKSLTSSKTAG